MSKIQTLIYLIFIGLEVMGVASLMEIYKKQIRKNKAKKFEIYIIAEILTALSIGILYGLHIFKPILGLIGAPLWSDIILYDILLFIFQMQADMKIIKKVIKSCAESFLISHGLSQEQVDDIFKSVGVRVSKETPATSTEAQKVNN